MKFTDDSIKFKCKKFTELSLFEFHDIMKMRQEVFIVEQNCPYLDCDGKDPQGSHAYIHRNHEILAYARLLPKGISYSDYCSIGRVITTEKERNTGLGRQLMEYCIEQCKKLYPGSDIKISAQSYILDFYSSLGFRITGDLYLEDDIPHQAMIYSHDN